MTDLRGKFIVFDGTEGCGKSTQTQLLKAALEARGNSVITVRDPGTTHIGEQIRAILLDPAHEEMGMRAEMLLYMAARSQMMKQTILPALAAGMTVLCDRFVSSTLAYQLRGDGLTATEIKAVGEIAISGRWPDLTILLDMPAKESLARVRRAKDRIEQRPMAYHEQVRRNYLAQAEGNPKFRVINANRDQDTVHVEVVTTLTEER